MQILKKIYTLGEGREKGEKNIKGRNSKCTMHQKVTDGFGKKLSN